ncbi:MULTISPECIES: hypothetical protein [Alkalispirochaeta]|nr:MULTISPECIES: hypothetical protein [Alkalispirochaeta]
MENKRLCMYGALLVVWFGVLLMPLQAEGRPVFYVHYGHTPVYLTDSDHGDVYGNSFEFGVFIDENTQIGVYNEQVSIENAADISIQGLSAEYRVLRVGGLATSTGIMLGSGDSGNVADIFGRFTLLASEHANINARIAYRTAPDEGAAAADNLNGIGLTIGFGINF